jgi:hypothetical protein
VAYAIIDTNVYVDYWQGSIPDSVLVDTRKQYVVRQSAVVLSELWRGHGTVARDDWLKNFAPWRLSYGSPPKPIGGPRAN